MRLISIVTAMLVVAMPAASLADPAGMYDVRGINPDNGGEYTGKVRVSRSEGTYKVVWTLADDQLSGIGVGIKLVDGKIVTGPASEDDIGISIAYGSGDTFGTVVYLEQPDGTWHGTWAYDGWDHVSTEDWFAKNRESAKTLDREPENEIRSGQPKQVISTPMPTMAGPKS